MKSSFLLLPLRWVLSRSFTMLKGTKPSVQSSLDTIQYAPARRAPLCVRPHSQTTALTLQMARCWSRRMRQIRTRYHVCKDGSFPITGQELSTSPCQSGPQVCQRDVTAIFNSRFSQQSDPRQRHRVRQSHTRTQAMYQYVACTWESRKRLFWHNSQEKNTDRRTQSADPKSSVSTSSHRCRFVQRAQAPFDANLTILLHSPMVDGDHCEREKATTYHDM
mmetsp:Transcript_3493/g.21949  ORF Transcript_3493/g.21949 Transcript_3493/m.21949 type:complete len:220 (+) Transcript_3493:1362-2021(+)